MSKDAKMWNTVLSGSDYFKQKLYQVQFSKFKDMIYNHDSSHHIIRKKLVKILQ